MHNEKLLKQYVRQAINTVQDRKFNQLAEEYRRDVYVASRVRLVVESEVSRIQEAKEDSPDELARERRSTGINRLADIMPKVVADLRVAYKSLTTSADQRESFREHILAAIQKTLNTVMPYGVPDIEEEEFDLALAEQTRFDVKVEKGELLDDAEPPPSRDGGESDDLKSFPDVEGAERTGRNYANETFARIRPTIVKAYQFLAEPTDRDDFYTWLLDNVEKYFEVFETEMTPDLDSPEYEEQMQDISDEDEEESDE